MLEIYTTGGGEHLTQTLNAVAAFCSSQNFLALLNIGLLVGLVAIVFQILLGGSIVEALKTYAIIAFIGGISITPKSDVIIFDETQGSLWFSRVDNVPLSVAYVGSFTSRVAHVLTRQTEAAFSAPGDLAYQRNGMLFGATLMTRSVRWQAVSRGIHDNLVNFMQSCMIDAVDLNYIEPDTLSRSGNLGWTIQNNLPASLIYYDTVTDMARSCKNAWPLLATAIENEVDKVLATQAASMFQAGPGDGATAINRLKDTIGDFATFAQMTANTAEEHITQAMLIAALDDAAVRGIAETGNAAAIEHLQSARAELQTRSSYQAIGANALSWVPYLKIVFENLYYGAFPIALVLMMTPLAMTVIRGYFGGFIWLASWEPLSAILHAIMMNGSVTRFQSVMSNSLTGEYDRAVLTWANHLGVYSVGQDVSVLAGYLMMSVPFVATAIFFGVNKMVGLATSMLAVSQSAASETGREVATGNLSYGNASVGNFSARNISRDNYTRNVRSFDNTTANRHSTSGYSDHGRDSHFAPDGTMITQNRNGTYGFDRGSSGAQTAVGVSIGNSLVSGIRTQASTMVERGQSERASFENSVSELSARTSGFAQSISSGEHYSTTHGAGLSNERRVSLDESASTVERYSQEHNVDRSTAMSMGIYAQGNIGWKNLSTGAKADLTRSGVTSERYGELLDAAKRTDLGRAVSDLDRAYTDYTQSTQNGASRSADKGERLSVDTAIRQARNAENYERAASSYSEQADWLRSQTSSGQADLGGAFTQFLLDEKGYNPTQVAEIMNAREFGPEHRALMSEFNDRYMRDVVAPQVQQNVGTPLPMPSSPGSPPQARDVFDYTATQTGEFSRGSVAVGTEIERSRQATISAEAAAQESGLVGKSDTVRQNVEGAQDSSWSGAAHSILGGRDSIDPPNSGLVQIPEGVRWQSSPDATGTAPVPLSAQDRDTVIRTVAGEAANQGYTGQQGVAFTIRNRTADDRWPGTAGEVARQDRQFSVWNDDGSGNDIARNLHPDSPLYKEIGGIVDDVFAGKAVDPTNGSTHYYSPKAMDALAANGYQVNREPGWKGQTEAESGGSVRILDHKFSGKARK